MDIIHDISEQIQSVCHVEKIILYNKRVNSSATITSLKFCVIINEGDSLDVERQIYSLVDSPIPFDVLVYTTEEWDDIKNAKDSFASHIDEVGEVL